MRGQIVDLKAMAGIVFVAKVRITAGPSVIGFFKFTKFTILLLEVAARTDMIPAKFDRSDPPAFAQIGAEGKGSVALHRLLVFNPQVATQFSNDSRARLCLEERAAYRTDRAGPG